MAYTKKIISQTCPMCGKIARYEVFGKQNMEYGPRCKKHAMELAAELNKENK